MKKNKVLIFTYLPILLISGCNKKENSGFKDEKEYEPSVLQERIDSGYFDTYEPSFNFEYKELSVTLAIDADFKKYRPSDFPDIELLDIKESFFNIYPSGYQVNERRNLHFYFSVETSNRSFVKSVAIKLTKYRFIYDAGYVGIATSNDNI